MAFTRSRHFYEALTSHVLGGSLTRILGSRSTSASCTPTASLGLHSIWPKRFYSPTLASRQLQQSSDSNSNAETPDKKPRREYNLSAPHKGRWTEEEDDLLNVFLGQGLTSAEFYKEFPNRTLGSLETRLSKLRIEGKKKIKELPTTLQHKKIARWTEVEDSQLKAGVEKFGKETASWPKIANFAVDGKRLGRSTTSCKRRWDIIDPEKVRKLGCWNPAEVAKLMMAIRDTLKEEESSREGMGEGKEDRSQKQEGLSLVLGPDELTRIDWRKVSTKMGTRSDVQCRSHIYKTMNSGMKGRWKDEEVERLREGLKDHGLNWNKLEEVVKTRSAFQIRQKYYLAHGLTRLPAA